ncbi:glucose-1-phosphate adenylyltransferase family protein [Deinococcus sp. QL22]|uniref:glucose-1-phosphate adenylyltransferase family protein n=1 Tax=Deinococcus sp. QL22 TaxID=2939437 RepID=UPI002017795B|nr:glucose-1-phosphate adenylyltransferase family protein [Deinococcus sp. QL22]UQN09613.1 glucose-1-phosphate adenylyltransferase [Deinococcus sp. QL22]
MTPKSQRSLSSGPSARGTRIQERKVLALILAGGKGSRLGVLTQHRAKPALTFGGTYRLIDFALSNCVHSGLSDVWVIEEYELHSLNDHLTNGRPWDLDRTHGGLQVLPPYSAANEGAGGFASGNADAIFIHRQLIRQYAPDVLLVLSADHIYTLNYANVIAEHLHTGAGVTLVTTPLPDGEDASRFGQVVAGPDGRVTQFKYKPDQSVSSQITTEVFVYDAPLLLDTLERLYAQKGEGERLGDFGHELLPELVKAGQAYASAFGGYWLDVGLPEAYWRAHQDLLHGRSVQLDDPQWPILTSSLPRMPARLTAGALVEDSLVSYGCRIEGEVRRSVLSPGVVVEAGARVEDAVLLRDVVVRSGARVSRAIIDEGATIESSVEGTGGNREQAGELAVVGAGVHVSQPVRGGEEVPPAETNG